jgi:hypothetical protein
MDFRDILYWKFLLEFLDIFQFWLKLDTNEARYEKRKGLYEDLRTSIISRHLQRRQGVLSYLVNSMILHYFQL